jgi:hypothetical protein
MNISGKGVLKIDQRVNHHQGMVKELLESKMNLLIRLVSILLITLSNFYKKNVS